MVFPIWSREGGTRGTIAMAEEKEKEEIKGKIVILSFFFITLFFRPHGHKLKISM